MSQVEADAAVRVVVITGAGRAFVAGGDIADLDSRQGLAHYEEFAGYIHRLFRRIETLDKPTIAAVNGFALGGGAELMLSTDIRLLSAKAKIGVPEINLGLFPGAGGSQRLIRQIPLCRAKELMFTGDAHRRGGGGGIGPRQPGRRAGRPDGGGAGAGGDHREQVAAGAAPPQAHHRCRRRHAAAGGARPRASHDLAGARQRGRARGLPRLPREARARNSRAPEPWRFSSAKSRR